MVVAMCIFTAFLTLGSNAFWSTSLAAGCERSVCFFFSFLFVSFLYFLFLFFLLSRVLTVAKRRIVVTFGLVSGLRVSKVSTVTDRKGPGRETQNCRHFWTRVGSSRLKSVNSHRSEGSWSRNAELSSLLDSRRVFASQKCQQSQIGRVLVAKRRTVVTFGLVSGLRVSKVSTVTNRKGPGRETQNCRHFWTRVRSSRLTSVNSHRSEGSWSRNAELSSLLDSSCVFASQMSTVTGIGGFLFAKRRT